MLQLLQANIGSNSLLVGVPDSWLKGCKFESWQEQQENFLSRVKCVRSYLVSVPPLCYRSGMQKTPVILPKVQVEGYT